MIRIYVVRSEFDSWSELFAKWCILDPKILSKCYKWVCTCTCANSEHAPLLSKMYASQIISYVASSLPNWFRTHCSAHRAQPSPRHIIASHICSLHMCLQSHISPVSSIAGSLSSLSAVFTNTNMWAAVVWLSACQCGPTTYKQIVAMWNFRVIQSL